MDIKELLKTLDPNLITEETANSIADAFEIAVNEKVNDKVSLTVEKALLKQDEDHAAKLQNLIERTDADHCQKLKLAIKAITESHTQKLSKIVNFYKKTIDEKATNFSNKIISDLDKFISVHLEKKIPYNQIQEAVNNTYARKQLDAIRKIISVDPSMVNESVKKTVTIGKEKIDSLVKQVNESNDEIAKLNNQIKHMRSAILLEGKVKGMPSSKKEFIISLLGDKDEKYITENFNYVVEMFENEEDEEKAKVATEATKTAISSGVKVPTNASVINESSNANNVSNNATISEYLSELKK